MLPESQATVWRKSDYQHDDSGLNVFNKLSIALLASMFALTGCTSTGSSSFRDMSSAYRDVLESYANDNILLNVVRSSQSMPVSFLDMPNVVGTGNVGANAGLNANIYGASPSSLNGFLSPYGTPFTSSYAPSVSMSVNTGFNFTQSSLDNSAFMTSFLSDIRPEVLSNLTNNQVGPKSILYSLVVDTIELRNSDNVIVSKFFNNPYMPDYEMFQQALYTLLQAGLSTEIVMQKLVMSAPMDADTLNKNMPALVAAFAQPGTMIVPIHKKGAKDTFQLVRMVPSTRMCLNKQDELAVLGHNFDDSAFCNSDAAGLDPAARAVAAGKDKLAVDRHSRLMIKLRSTRNVFDYLGTLVSLQNASEPRMIKVMNSDLIERNPALIKDNATALPLFVVEKNQHWTKSLVTIDYHGDAYSIPAESNSYSKQVLTLVSQLLTLNKVPGSIPASPAVLIK